MSSLMSVRRFVGARDCLRSVFERRPPVDAAPVMFISESVRNALVDYMQRCLPYEGVGLLATSAMAPRMVAHRFYPGRNVDASPHRYTMDPIDVLGALHDMERRRMWLMAIVHSHPDTPAVPSARDLAEAEVPGALSLIVGLTPVVELRAWQFVFSDDGIAVRSREVQIVESCDSSRTAARLQFTSY
jgi:[CysO sulfur-carrier protein]-S-L-cysteine hydrolase